MPSDPAEERLRAKVRLYRFFNFAMDAHGRPFALCDFHVATQVIPEQCTLQKLADRAVGECNVCAQQE